ncbi:uncharacterized protein LOC120921629 [Rana temporaria]|uniref:uncharacterized protein LOC120921629 n=1 Tax=Rana temporaria TaxID=8407 RepID=UPI001AADE02F|nr:uncharacterized protein LOC120921629 [Rana temporaria]
MQNILPLLLFYTNSHSSATQTRHPTAAMCPLCVLLLCPLRVLLLWALLCPGTGNVPSVQEEIFTRPGSDLLLPVNRHLTLTHINKMRCDRIEWRYKDRPRHTEARIFLHRECTLDRYKIALFPNMKISENGSLIISNVTPENDGIYFVYIENSVGRHIQRHYYTVHVEGKSTQPPPPVLAVSSPLRVFISIHYIGEDLGETYVQCPLITAPSSPFPVDSDLQCSALLKLL